MEKFDPKALRVVINECGVSIDELADRTQIKRATLYNYLNGTTPITVEALYKISNILESLNSEIFNENVLMRVLMRVPTNVLMKDKDEWDKEMNSIINRKLKAASSNYEDKLIVNIRDLSAENALLKKENAELRAKIDELNRAIGRLERDKEILVAKLDKYENNSSNPKGKAV